MIIKSHIRAGYRDAAAYLKAQGQNEKIRHLEISDIEAANLDEAFQNMWAIACYSQVKKPLHHISINPYKDERLTDEQVITIVEHCERAYGYKAGQHQRVIVEHIKEGRQHFHVMWNRVSLGTGKAVWPGLHWKKSKEVARKMEAELDLKQPTPRRTTMRNTPTKHHRPISTRIRVSTKTSIAARSDKTDPALQTINAPMTWGELLRTTQGSEAITPAPPRMTRQRPTLNEAPKPPLNRDDIRRAMVIAWAWEHGRTDILALYGIHVTPEVFEP